MSRSDLCNREIQQMTEQERIEELIREVVANEPHASILSDQLFRPDGLFNQLAGTEEERRSVVQSPLFRQAQRRLLALQQQEAAEFKRTVEQAQGTLPETDFLFKLEPTPSR
jgi:hypothetical protein